MFPRFFETTLLFGAAMLMLATPSLSSVTDGINMDDMGIFELAPNGTVFSVDRNGTVIDTKQLNGTEFTALTGCNMVTPDMPSSAVSETDQCLQKDNVIIPNSNALRKRDGEIFERDAICVTFGCTVSVNCQGKIVKCGGCVKALGQGRGLCAP